MFASSHVAFARRLVWSAEGCERNCRAVNLRAPAECCVLLLTGLCLLRTFVIDWYQVSSGSMAPTLLGPHRRLACGECGLGYACDAQDAPPPGRRALCPNCWSWGADLASTPALAGERVLLVRDSWGLLAPHRWSVVAFRAPHRAGRVQVKRVLGLPGESIELVHGDVYINGLLQRKTLVQQRAIAQLVHNAAYDPHRWVPSARQGGYGWRLADEGFVCTAQPPSAAQVVHWLTYRHQQPIDLNGRQREAPLEDRYAYNQVRPVLQSFPVNDLLLSCQMAWQGRGELFFRLHSGCHQVLVTVALPAGELTLAIDGTTTARTRLHDLPQGERHWELSTFDRQVLLAVDGQTLLRYELPEAAIPRRTRAQQVPATAPTPHEASEIVATHGSSRPLAVGSRGLNLTVRKLCVWRDLYYYWPHPARNGQGLSQTVTLEPDEYFVVGDNIPISDDSRTWPARGVPRHLLVGRPLLAYSLDRLRWFNLEFSIPRLSSIRYIR